MRNCFIYAIPSYVEFRNSDCRKFNVKKQGFRKPGITRKINGNFNVNP